MTGFHGGSARIRARCGTPRGRLPSGPPSPRSRRDPRHDEVVLHVDSVLVDIDGVLVVSWTALPGAADAFAQLSDRFPVRLLTNTTSASRATIAERLTAAGMAVGPELVMTAPAATAAWLRRERPDARCYLINSGDLGHDLAGVDWVDEHQAADVVVLGGAGPEFSYEQMNHALGLLLGGAELVGMHRNRYWRTRDGVSLDTGAYLAALEQAAGVDPIVLGKPSPDFFATALVDIGTTAERAVMVGDDIENDVLAAQACGMTGVLVRTGKYRAETVAHAPGRPDHAVDSIADVPSLLI